MICRSLSSAHNPGDQDVCDIALANQNIVEDVPMARPGVHPRSFVFVAELEHSIRDNKLVISAGCQQTEAVVIANANAMPTNDASPKLPVSAHPRIKITHNKNFVQARGPLDGTGEAAVE